MVIFVVLGNDRLVKSHPNTVIEIKENRYFLKNPTANSVLIDHCWNLDVSSVVFCIGTGTPVEDT